MKLLLDTNILIDYYAQRQPFFQDALLLRAAAITGDVELWCSVQSFADAEYILRGALPLNELRAMMSTSLGFLKVASPAATDLEAGLASGRPDLEDYLIAACANRVKADYIITRDKDGFANAKIPAVSPAAFFELLSNEYGVTYDVAGL